MPSMSVVEPLDVVEQRQSCRISRRERLPGEQLAFERREETLRHRVVEAVAPTAHRGRHPRLAQSSPKREARVLAPLIRMVDDPGRPTLPERHFDCFDHQFRAYMLRHRPANDAPTARIEDDREIEEARPRRDICDVRDPEPVGSGRDEIALDEVGRGCHLWAAPRRARPFAAVASLQSGVTQQARDPFA